jgi:hypothetical protein
VSLKRDIRVAKQRLEAIKNREMWPLSPAEQARMATLRGRAAVKDVRGSNPKKVAKLDARVEELWEGHERRAQAVLTGLEQAEAQKIQERAARTVARATGGRRK